MKISRTLFFAVLFLPVISAAQSFQPATVINMKGDTLHGSIDYADWDNNPNTISFKSGETAAVQKLSPADIKFFSVSAGRLAEYESYTGPVSIDHVDIDHISVGLDSSSKVESVFLHVLQDGKNLKLFRYSDSQKVRYFIASDFASTPMELTYHIYLKDGDTNGIDRTTYDTAFKGQLYNAASKAGVATPALKALIAKSNYKEEDIIGITSVINGVPQGDISKTSATKTKPSHLGLAVALAGAVVVFLVMEFSGVGK